MTATSADPMPARGRPVDPRLFASLDPLQLSGSRCADCGTVVFPAISGCPCCSSASVAVVALPSTGTLWSWTVQHFEPKLPYVRPAGGFEPFALGYVDLGVVLVESRLVGASNGFRIGQQVRLVSLPIPPAPGEAEPVLTFAFAPAEGASDGVV